MEEGIDVREILLKDKEKGGVDPDGG